MKTEETPNFYYELIHIHLKCLMMCAPNNELVVKIPDYYILDFHSVHSMNSYVTQNSICQNQWN